MMLSGKYDVVCLRLDILYTGCLFGGGIENRLLLRFSQSEIDISLFYYLHYQWPRREKLHLPTHADFIFYLPLELKKMQN